MSDAQKAATYSTENESLQPIRGHGLPGLGTLTASRQLTGRTLFLNTNSPSCMLVTMIVPLSKYG